MATPIIQFSSYNFKYRAQKETTLHQVDLTIYPGEKILIVGPSGSGKSTLGQCLNALIPFSWKGEKSGQLMVEGKDPWEKGIFEMSMSVGTVLQDSDGQFVGLTVGEDMAFALENEAKSQEDMKEIICSCAKLVDMENFLTSSPQNLSGGQKQRVALGGVMTLETPILLFDEPLANLDPATGKKAIELIDEIHKKTDTTILIIEHRLEDVLHRRVDRIILMEEGRVVLNDTPDKVLSLPALKKAGIRGPLYLTALEYAGSQIQEKDRPSDLGAMNLERFREPLRRWYAATEAMASKGEKNSLLRLENVDFAYEPGKEVLKNISFDIQKGDMISIVGTNGAGKSTLSKLICGFYPLTGGRILYQGEDLRDQTIRERSEKIGMVMQNPNQMISKPMIFDEVALGLVSRGVSQEEIRFRTEETLKICGLYPFRNWPISALSFGQKKRVTIASILVLQPKVIILDEPTAGQDFRHYTEIMTFLEKLNQEQGITIILITHDMHLMLEYTSRSVVLSEGRLLADMDSARVLTDQALAEKANLKVTSLYDLALQCQLPDPTEFVRRFIAYDREVRAHGCHADLSS